jgi:hypothetical protein
MTILITLRMTILVTLQIDGAGQAAEGGPGGICSAQAVDCTL